MTIAAAFTAGDSDNLMVGRNGVFYDRKGRDWDATIVKIVEHPISIRQAFWLPYKQFGADESATRCRNSPPRAREASPSPDACAARRRRRRRRPGAAPRPRRRPGPGLRRRALRWHLRRHRPRHRHDRHGDRLDRHRLPAAPWWQMPLALARRRPAHLRALGADRRDQAAAAAISGRSSMPAAGR